MSFNNGRNNPSATTIPEVPHAVLRTINPDTLAATMSDKPIPDTVANRPQSCIHMNQICIDETTDDGVSLPMQGPKLKAKYIPDKQKIVNQSFGFSLQHNHSGKPIQRTNGIPC